MLALTGIVTEVRPVLANAYEPMSVTPLKFLIEVRELQPENAEEPMLASFAPSGMVIEVRPVLANALEPMSVTLSGIVIEVRAVHP